MFVKLTNMEKAMAGHQHIMAYYAESPCAANGFRARAPRAILHGGMFAQVNARVAVEVAAAWAQYPGNATAASASASASASAASASASAASASTGSASASASPSAAGSASAGSVSASASAGSAGSAEGSASASASAGSSSASVRAQQLHRQEAARAIRAFQEVHGGTCVHARE